MGSVGGEHNAGGHPEQRCGGRGGRSQSLERTVVICQTDRGVGGGEKAVFEVGYLFHGRFFDGGV